MDTNAGFADNDNQNYNEMAVSEMIIQQSQSPMSSATAGLVGPGPNDKLFPSIAIGKINESE